MNTLKKKYHDVKSNTEMPCEDSLVQKDCKDCFLNEQRFINQRGYATDISDIDGNEKDKKRSQRSTRKRGGNWKVIDLL